MSDKKQKEKLRIKQGYEHQLKIRIKGKLQQDKEEVLVGELYSLKNILLQTTAQIAEIEQRISIASKFSLIDGKLAYDGIVCNEEVM